ncbi:MAG TPA: hypothetical protein VGT99_00870 [Gammaproteobacteria bacterium]|nr:hypothetical protein [Gammaproteobacteria bacterium]
MNTYPIKDDRPGHCWAFEIDHVYITARPTARVLAQVQGVSDIEIPKLFRGKDDIRIKFKYRGRDCVVWEPWGDSSRYWIGPENAMDKSLDLKDVQSAFEKHDPPTLIGLLFSILTLDIGSFLKYLGFNRS